MTLTQHLSQLIFYFHLLYLLLQNKAYKFITACFMITFLLLPNDHRLYHRPTYYIAILLFLMSYFHLNIELPQQELLLFTVISTKLCLWLNFSALGTANTSPIPKTLLTKAKQEVYCQFRVITFMLTTAAFSTSVYICMLLTSKKCARFSP